ncbi:MAG TPA: 50S ribosomal protein L22 [Dehalococcoidales bacterium]|nr:MAG: 50S ribosomal protein L22 [Chloroflexi bacterium RBG_16_60_22]HJX12314.1 50S ribosomal protein L22 [Dehalococcoidales bacterium]
MEVRAVAKNTGIPASKVRPLVDMVRGKRVEEALTLLRFTPTPKAKLLAKVVKSAAASAENNFQMDPADLKIVRIFADEARSMRRFRPRSRGRVSPIRKRSSHITVIVAEQEG